MPADPESLVEIWEPRDLYEGAAMRDALEAADIPAHLAGEHMSRGQRLRIMVRGRDREQAEAILRGGDWPTYTPGRRRR